MYAGNANEIDERASDANASALFTEMSVNATSDADTATPFASIVETHSAAVSNDELREYPFVPLVICTYMFFENTCTLDPRDVSSVQSGAVFPVCPRIHPYARMVKLDLKL
jgi:hypothetical protein